MSIPSDELRPEADQRLNGLVELVDLTNCKLGLSIQALNIVEERVALSLEFLQCCDNSVA